MPHSPSDEDVVLESPELITMFLDQLEEDLDYFEARVLQNNLEQSCAELLRRLHSSKGAASSLSYGIVVSLLHSLEDGLVQYKKIALFDEQQQIKKVDRIRQVIVLSRNESLSRKEYLDAYEKLSNSISSQESNTVATFRILIADRSAALHSLLKSELKEDACALDFTSDGLLALSKMIREKYQLLVCGKELNGLDGIALIAALKINQESRSVPIALVSSQSELDILVRPDLVLQRSVEDRRVLVEFLRKHLLMARAG